MKRWIIQWALKDVLDHPTPSRRWALARWCAVNCTGDDWLAASKEFPQGQEKRLLFRALALAVKRTE